MKQKSNKSKVRRFLALQKAMDKEIAEKKHNLIPVYALPDRLNHAIKLACGLPLTRPLRLRKRLYG